MAVPSSSDVVEYNGYFQATQATLLPGNIANFITAVALAARLSLRCSALLMEALFESAKYGTVFSFGLSRQALINAISAAKKLHALTYPVQGDGDSHDFATTINSVAERTGFLEILDKYTNLGVYIIHHSFTLVELFALSGLQFTSQTIQSGIKAAEESVQIIDGIFGSNETSRAIASIITMVHRELLNDPEFELVKSGKTAILSGLTKAMTAFAVLQSVTHKRTMAQVKITGLWKGLVIEEETGEQALVRSNNESDGQGTDVIHELEEILASRPDDNSSSLSLATAQSYYGGDVYPMYEITTTTQRITTQTTRIRPIDPTKGEHNQPKTKYIVVKSEEEEAESFMAVVNQDDNETSLPGAWITHELENGDQDGSNHQTKQVVLRDATQATQDQRPKKGLKIMLSAVSKKFSRKKVERKVNYRHDTLGRTLSTTDERPDWESSEDEYFDVTESINASTSTTLQTSTQYHSNPADNQTKPLPSVPNANPTKIEPEPEPTKTEPESQPRSVKRQSSWGRLKLKERRKSVVNLFQKGAEALQAQQKSKKHAPPLPSNPSTSLRTMYIQQSRNTSTTSVDGHTSMTSVSRTLMTTAITTPSSSQQTRVLVRSPSLPSTSKKRKPRSPLDTEPDPRNFPRRHIIDNIARFIRYASAAYGESFMRILGIGDIPSVLPSSHHPNHHAFAHHTGVSVDDILLSSYTEQNPLLSVSHPQLHALVHYVTVDHTAQAIVLTCRGTLGLSDVLTDLTCEYASFTHEDQTYRAHSGMLEAAQLLAKSKGKVYQAICEGLERHPSYGLVLCGHSLGAGVAGLLSVLWSVERQRVQEDHPIASLAIARDPVPFVTSRFSGLPSGRPIHCYMYGPPCTMSLELSQYCARGLVTSVVHGYDIVPCLSLGLLRDFKNIAVSLYQESSVAEEILTRIVGRHVNKPPEQEKEDEQWFWAMIKTMRADMRADKLYPPGTVYLIESVPQLYASTHKKAHMVSLNRCDDVPGRFSEIVFSRTMFMDHSPNMYENAIRQLVRGYFQ